jgi:hypothetical protein
MTRADVEGLLGGPPGNYGEHAGGESRMSLEGYHVPPGAVELVWCDDSIFFMIFFDAKGCVVGHRQAADYRQEPPEGFFARLRRALGF